MTNDTEGDSQNWYELMQDIWLKKAEELPINLPHVQQT
jgi:hypothetical protein